MYRRCTIYFDYYDISTCTEDVQNMYRRCTKHVQKMYKIVQKMYNIFRILIEVPDYRSSFFFFSRNEEEAIPPGEKKY